MTGAGAPAVRLLAETALRLTSGTVLLETGGDGMLLSCHAPIAAYVPPAVMNWAAHGATVPAEHEAAYARCLEAWRSAGLQRDEAPENVPLPGQGPTAEMGRSRLRRTVGRPVLVIASSPGCGYCRHLRADLQANRKALARMDASVLITGDGRPEVWGGRPVPGYIEELADAWADVARLGTPSAVLLTPDDSPRFLRGFDAVTTALIELGGEEPGQVVCETPTSCSVTVGAEPVDAVVTARARGKAVGIAARGAEPVKVAGLVAGKPAPNGDAGYVPVTLRVRRPRNLWLIFRGGELLARSRSEEEALSLLKRVVAGFGPPEAHQTRLLCGALVHTQGRAMLFPRSWLTYFVERSSLLARSGWRPSPDPFVILETNPVGAPVLVHPSPAGMPRHMPVSGVLAQPPDHARPAAHMRGRTLASIVNWHTRPASPQQLHAACTSLSALPIHLGTRQESLTFLVRMPTPGG
ncbi:hypothetical protein [Streptomyces sp. NPDC037389]|uniref:hypothetical protein n=1 Tax=Streptomyces sp. NPDC037389 TaxID=3155369 RepID=UPI0033EC752F